jgi:hypothetical protein
MGLPVNLRLPVVSERMCSIHRMWKKKGQCSLCYEAERQQRIENEQTGGSNKPPVLIRKI